MRGLCAVLFFAAIALTFTFIVLPVVAIFFHVPISALLHQLSNPVVTDALVDQPEDGARLAGRDPRARHDRGLLPRLEALPRPLARDLDRRAADQVLPPAVAGLGLLVAFGRFGLLGSTFDWLGINVSFNQTAVVIAITLVAGPFYVRQGIAAFEAIDMNLVAASRTLGAGPARTFFRVTLPLARGGLAAGEALCLARGLGEFGATILFAGSLPGRTETLPLAIYTVFEELGRATSP